MQMRIICRSYTNRYPNRIIWFIYNYLLTHYFLFIILHLTTRKLLFIFIFKSFLFYVHIIFFDSRITLYSVLSVLIKNNMFKKNYDLYKDHLHENDSITSIVDINGNYYKRYENEKRINSKLYKTNKISNDDDYIYSYKSFY